MAETPANTPAAAAGAGPEIAVATKVIERVIPSAWGAIKMWWQGEILLVLGPERAGKTSFLDYLQYGILRVEQSTPNTLDVERRSNFIVKLGRESALVLQVRRPRDTPGHVAPYDQVKYITHLTHEAGSAPGTRKVCNSPKAA